MRILVRLTYTFGIICYYLLSLTLFPTVIHTQQQRITVISYLVFQSSLYLKITSDNVTTQTITYRQQPIGYWVLSKLIKRQYHFVALAKKSEKIPMKKRKYMKRSIAIGINAAPLISALGVYYRRGAYLQNQLDPRGG